MRQAVNDIKKALSFNNFKNSDVFPGNFVFPETFFVKNKKGIYKIDFLE